MYFSSIANSKCIPLRIGKCTCSDRFKERGALGHLSAWGPTLV